jgi:hypothetical protein
MPASLAELTSSGVLRGDGYEGGDVGKRIVIEYDEI